MSTRATKRGWKVILLFSLHGSINVSIINTAGVRGRPGVHSDQGSNLFRRYLTRLRTFNTESFTLMSCK